MIRVNAVGSIIETLYCLILFWGSEPNQLTRPLLSCLAVCLGTLAAVQMFDDIEDGKSFLGTINVIVNMITFTTPLLTVKQVLRSVFYTIQRRTIWTCMGDLVICPRFMHFPIARLCKF